MADGEDIGTAPKTHHTAIGYPACRVAVLGRKLDFLLGEVVVVVVGMTFPTGMPNATPG
jgi:hypothetical protein